MLRGKGYWKFNNDLLTNTEYIALVKNVIKNTMETVNFEDKNMLWEYIKCEIRSQTILYAGERARENTKTEKKLRTKVENFEKNLQNEDYS